MDTGIAIFVGAILATAGWLYNGRIQRDTSRRQHTYQIVTQLEGDREFQAARKLLRDLITAGNVPEGSASIDAEDAERLDYLLNRYEFLAASIWCGDIDESFVRRTERSRLIRLYEVLADYIEANRTTHSQPSMWRNGHDMAERWKSESTLGPCCAACEWWHLRPFKEHPKWASKGDATVVYFRQVTIEMRDRYRRTESDDW